MFIAAILGLEELFMKAFGPNEIIIRVSNVLNERIMKYNGGTRDVIVPKWA